MKKVLVGSVLAGVVSAMCMMTGCGGKKVQVAPAAGTSGLLGTRGEVPPPMASPASIKAVQMKGANGDAGGAVVSSVGNDAVLPEPSLGGDNGVTGNAPLVSVVPVSQENAFVPAPASPAADGNAPLIQDLNAGKDIPVAGDIAPAAAGAQTYTVQKGDSLSSIARKCGTNWQALAEANGITNANSLKVGQALVLPADAVAPAQDAVAAPVAAAVPAQPNHQVKAAPAAGAAHQKKDAAKPLPADGKYTVKAGDSLWKIAHKYGLSSAQIRSDNNLKTDVLRVGQVLVLKTPAAKNSEPAKDGSSAKAAPRKSAAKPAAASADSDATPGLSNDKYAVKSGDSLWILAKRFKVSVDDIIAWNNLKNTNLHIGQVLIVKKEGAPAAAAAAAATAPTPANEPVVDLGGKAAPAPAADAAAVSAPVAVGTATDAVAAPAVNIDAQALPAAVENAPAPAAATTVSYTVQEGDTLTAILRKNMMSPEQFKELNPWYVEGEDLKPGTEIKITFEP